jgi:hypothetical protein
VVVLCAVLGLFLWRQRRQATAGRDIAKSEIQDGNTGAIPFVPPTNVSKQSGEGKSVSIQGMGGQLENVVTSVRDSARLTPVNLKVLLHFFLSKSLQHVLTSAF